MARRKSTEEETTEQPTFEQALGGLEAIVEAMEHEHLPLEDLVAHYEKGSALLTRPDRSNHPPEPERNCTGIQREIRRG